MASVVVLVTGDSLLFFILHVPLLIILVSILFNSLKHDMSIGICLILTLV